MRVSASFLFGILVVDSLGFFWCDLLSQPVWQVDYGDCRMYIYFWRSFFFVEDDFGSLLDRMFQS